MQNFELHPSETGPLHAVLPSARLSTTQRLRASDPLELAALRSTRSRCTTIAGTIPEEERL